jgi:hypothetical protein
MDKTFALATLNYFDMAVDAQKKVISDFISAQKNFSAQVIEASSKAVASVTPYLAGNTVATGALEQINTALISAVNNKDALKLQDEILTAYDKQVTVNRTFLKNAVDLIPAKA